jgi:hypothetical protein
MIQIEGKNIKIDNLKIANYSKFYEKIQQLIRN